MSQSNRQLVGFCVAATGLLACCKNDQVLSFVVTIPHQITTVHVCAGDQVAIAWRVQGKAAFGTAKGDPQHPPLSDTAFTMKPVPSIGGESFTVNESTAFRIRATDANIADNVPYADQYAVVPTNQGKGNTATCDASGHCAASFSLDASASMTVRTVSSPTLTLLGKLQAVHACVRP